jgi:hypothetical protein
MPLGLWKSKWEIHREDTERFREDTERYRQDTERFREETRKEREASESRWAEFGEETREHRTDYERELAATRQFNREMLDRLDKTNANLVKTLTLVGDELGGLRAEVRAQTQAILRLVDRFEEWDGRPPV